VSPFFVFSPISSFSLLFLALKHGSAYHVGMNKTHNNTPLKLVVALTGASGMPYASHLLKYLAGWDDIQVHCIMSRAARRVLELESFVNPSELEKLAHEVYDEKDIAAPPASGSWRHDGMIICPCSMSSLSAIAHGLGSNLIHRAADVCLKERRKLLLVTRETPLNMVHIENMAAVTRAGGTIMPASPGFYHGRTDMDGLTAFMVARICDHLHIDHQLMPQWQGAGGTSNGT
jgi:4-hydroxy-3-polyprenylbenzoate decarboxylase